MGRTQARVLGTHSNQKELAERASTLLDHAKKTGFVHVHGDPATAVFAFLKPRQQRVRGERVFYYSHAQEQKKTLDWIHQEIEKYAPQAPLHTRISVAPHEVDFFEPLLRKNGFLIRYDVQFGNTDLALRELVRHKNPKSDLTHIHLQIRPLKESEVNAAIRLQKKVFQKNPEHGNHSHTSKQLAADRKEYRSTIRKKNGLLLGVFRGKKLLGFMATFIHELSGAGNRSAGITMCLDPTIQGMGVSKTGYLLLLRHLKSEKVKKFYGGTSQPAIKSLGKIMKREVADILFLKSKL